MITRRTLIACFLLFASFSLAAEQAEYDGYIVKFNSDKSKGLVIAEMKSLGEVTPMNVNFGSFATIRTDAKNLELLESMYGVEYVEPNWIITLDQTYLEEEVEMVQDPSFNRQWGLVNDGKNSGSWWRPGREGEDINALRAWEVAQGDSELIIAVIDTGIDYTHEDLIGNLWFNEEGHNGYNFVNNTPDPMDGHGHGTHCAGIIGAVHNELGIAGVMANVKMMGLKFLADNGSGTTEGAIRAIDYAIENGAHITSNSWGGGAFSQALKEVIQAANDAGIIFVAAAGNNGRNTDARPMYPANYNVDNIISVGSMDGRGERSNFSNFGEESVHVFAPGSSIFSTVQNNGYRNMSGTSMAAPFVTGAIGLMMEAERNLSPAEVRQRVIDTAVRSEHLGENTSQSGRLDAYRLIMGITE